MPTKREVARRCAPILDRILRDIEAEDRAARVNRRRAKPERAA